MPTQTGSIDLRGVKQSYESVEVGGRNLLVGLMGGSGVVACSTSDLVNHIWTRSTTATTESYVQLKNMTFEPGVTYTLSCFAKSNGKVSSMDMCKVHSSGGGSHQSKTSISLTTEYVKYSWTFVCNANAVETAYIRFDNNGSTTSGTEAIMYIKEPKLERGNKATSWSPAPEDELAKTIPIYARTNSSTAPTNKPTVIVTNTADTGTTAPATNGNGWTKMLMPRICSSNVAYKYLWTCNQLISVGGDLLGNTDVVADNGTTVINGDEIVTGTISANRLNIAGTITAINNNTTTTINGGKITANTLSVNAVKSDSGTFNTANIPNLSADKITTGTINIGRIPSGALNSELTTSITNAGKTASNYITYIGSENGIRVYDGQSENENVNFAQINSGGMQVYKGGEDEANKVAEFGETVTIGRTGDYRTIITNGSFQIGNADGQILSIANTGATRLATVTAYQMPQSTTVFPVGSTDDGVRYNFSFKVPETGVVTIQLKRNGVVKATGTYDPERGGTINLTDGSIDSASGLNMLYLRGLAYSMYAKGYLEVSKQFGGALPQTIINDEVLATYTATVDVPKMSFVGDLCLGDATMNDFVVEQGTDGIWTYRKWNSGIAECWGRYSVTLTKYTTVGSFAGYYTTVSFPTGLFVAGSIPTHTYTATVGTGFAMPASGMNISNTSMYVYALGTASASNQSCVFDIIAKGRWK